MQTQQKLFDDPRPMHICTENGHAYEVAGEGYYKAKEDGERDTFKVFRVLFCPYCASSVEICVVDRTPLPQNKLPLENEKKVARKTTRRKVK